VNSFLSDLPYATRPLVVRHPENLYAEVTEANEQAPEPRGDPNNKPDEARWLAPGAR
jgi:hypothetical protein